MLTLPQLDAVLQSGGVVVLPNQHGARLWQETIGRWRCDELGVAVVAAARIHAIDLWLNELWQTFALHCDHPVLSRRVLSAAEETLLWQRVLDNSSSAAELLNPGGTARQLREAQRLLNFWQVNLSDVRRYLPAVAPGDPDADQALAWRWLQDFRTLCDRQHCLPQSAMLPALLDVLGSSGRSLKPLLPAEMVWLDFDDPPPLYRQLQQALQELDVEIAMEHFAAANPSISVHAHADTAAECRAAARWAKEIIDANPDARVGIVCPNLQSLRPQLLRIFQQHVSPAQLFCSSAETLADQTFTEVALQLLTLHSHNVDSLQFCRLLRSSYLRAHDAEGDARAALEWRIRRRSELQTTLADIREWCIQQDKPWYSPVLGDGLLQISQALRRSRNKPLSQWLDDFQTAWHALLNLDVLTGNGSQALRNAWEQWLDDCRQFAATQGSVSREQAQSALFAFAQHRRLSEGNTAAAIHILAPVETAGLRFTHVHVLQMQSGTWPSELHPNACLPWRLQHEYEMPAVDPNRELARAKMQITRLEQNTEHALRFSYPLQVDDLPVLPNPLLAAFPVSDESAGGVPQALHPSVATFPRNNLLTVEEVTHLPLTEQELHQAPGAMLSAQTLCPFRSFALHRLYSRELPKLFYGLPNSVIGELVHRVMQVFWQTLRQSSQLSTLDETEIERHLRDAIAEPLRQLQQKYPHTLTPRLLELEQQRVLLLLKSWLENEKQRAPFTVAMTEHDIHWQHQNLRLNLRIDRVDVTANGRIVVDYKTGNVATTYWQEERAQQPQLLLYQQALQHAIDAPVTGVLYAKVTLEKMGYNGITAQSEGFDALVFSANKHVSAQSWEELQQHWQDKLQSLAQEYLDGFAAVAPQFRQSCEHCHLGALCRVAHVTAEQEDA